MKDDSGFCAGSIGTVVVARSFLLISSPRSVRGTVDEEHLLKHCRHCIVVVGLCSCLGSKKAEVDFEMDRNSIDTTRMMVEHMICIPSQSCYQEQSILTG